MKIRHACAISFSLIALIGTACQGLGEEDIRSTIEAEIATALYISGLETAAAGVVPVESVEAEVPTTTPADGIDVSDNPQVSVSQDTNCRTGPAIYYDYVTTITTGMVLDVVGIPADANVTEYVLVNNQSVSNPRCWLWLRYADNKDYSAYELPTFQTPATPTPTSTPTDTATPTSTPTSTETLPSGPTLTSTATTPP
jgi:hypothetical protein